MVIGITGNVGLIVYVRMGTLNFASMFGTNMRSPETQYSKFPVILVHVLFWAAFLFLPLFFFETYDDRMRFLRFWGYQIILTGIYFYVNYLIIIPRILFRKKIFLYLLTAISILILMMVITYFYFEILYDLGLKIRRPGYEWKPVYIPLFPVVLAFAISTFIRVTDQWLQGERKKQVLEKEKLISELGFLKSQIHPHFLFNTLNNICSLARKKSEETEHALIKLSDIMRYMIDESKEEKVLLSKEIRYLNSYIELQRLRLTGDVRVDLTITGDPRSLTIEPLLLIPFVENAFKHGIGNGVETVILITLNIRQDRLQFIVENRITRTEGKELLSDWGIGLKNVMRRLELLYPGQHLLKITDGEETFRVDLTMNLA